MGVDVDGNGEILACLDIELRDAVGAENVECNLLRVLLLSFKNVGVALPLCALGGCAGTRRQGCDDFSCDVHSCFFLLIDDIVDKTVGKTDALFKEGDIVGRAGNIDYVDWAREPGTVRNEVGGGEPRAGHLCLNLPIILGLDTLEGCCVVDFGDVAHMGGKRWTLNFKATLLGQADDAVGRGGEALNVIVRATSRTSTPPWRSA